MASISTIQPGYYRLPLPTVLSDAMHGDMPASELNNVRLRDADGVEGSGYTFTFLEAHGFGLDDYIADPLRIDDGFAIAPDRLRHGIAVDWDRLDSIRA